jgi:hypothetical protein
LDGLKKLEQLSHKGVEPLKELYRENLIRCTWNSKDSETSIDKFSRKEKLAIPIQHEALARNLKHASEMRCVI